MDQEWKEHPDSYFCFKILLKCIWIVERISGSCAICWEELWLSSADCSWLHCVCSAGWSAEAPWETKTIWPKVSKWCAVICSWGDTDLLYVVPYFFQTGTNRLTDIIVWGAKRPVCEGVHEVQSYLLGQWLLWCCVMFIVSSAKELSDVLSAACLFVCLFLSGLYKEYQNRFPQNWASKNALNCGINLDKWKIDLYWHFHYFFFWNNTRIMI